MPGITAGWFYQANVTEGRMEILHACRWWRIRGEGRLGCVHEKGPDVVKITIRPKSMLTLKMVRGLHSA